MLQGSDYRVGGYVKWLARTKDFRKVSKRGQLHYTSKAKIILALAWLTLLSGCALVAVLLLHSVVTHNLIMGLVSALLLLVLPLVLAYVIVVPLFFIEVLIQNPIQRKMISDAKQIIAQHPALKIAVVGSYGKSTAKEVLKTVLSQGKKVAATPGNMNTMIGISRFAKTLDGDEEVIILELGEEKVGDIKQLCALTVPDMGIITGINEAHLSSFGTIENTISTIFELQDYLGGKTLYKNLESALVDSKTNQDDIFAYSNKGVNGWRISNVKVEITGTSFSAKKGAKVISAHTGLLGQHNLGILAVAISIADSLGMTKAQITKGLDLTVPYEHRMEARPLGDAWIISDTYNGNSEGVKVGLNLLKQLDAKRKVYVTPGLVDQGDKTQEIHENIGRQIAEVADVVVLMNNSVTDYISTGLRDGKYAGSLLIVDDPLEFYTNLGHFVAAGDVVMMQNDWPDNYA
jgi:UDP-N-acetylmuramoyl-tripeptide--D-alanyl-D-alanine ligase